MKASSMPASNTGDFALAVDIGGTKVALTILDSTGKCRMPVEKFPVPFDKDHHAIPEKLIELFAPTIEVARSQPGIFRGIGVSCCGNLEEDTGMAVLIPNLGWRYVPLGEMIHKRFDVDVFAATDVRMALLAEVVWGAAKGIRNVAWATVGTGYGGYLFLDGKLHRGTHGFAGNFGHMTLDEVNGYPCGCGRKGCFETFVAGPAIARAGQRAADKGESPYLQAIAKKRPIATSDVFDAEADGDPSAAVILEQVVRMIAINLGGLVNILDLDMVVVGGGVASACPDFVERISQRIRSHLMTEEAIRDLQVVKESFENSALVGAAVDVFLRQGILTL
jgi:glucokinase